MDMTTKSAPRGRPATREDGKARTKVIGVRVTAEEEAMIVEAAPMGVPPSVWVRQLALAAAARRSKR